MVTNPRRMDSICQFGINTTVESPQYLLLKLFSPTHPSPETQPSACGARSFPVSANEAGIAASMSASSGFVSALVVPFVEHECWRTNSSIRGLFVDGLRLKLQNKSEPEKSKPQIFFYHPDVFRGKIICAKV